jgi:hypothetical protein
MERAPMEAMFQAVVEGAGGRFVRFENNTVYFSDAEGRIHRLFSHACTAINVQLAIKNAREPVIGFEPLLPASVE